MRLCSRLFSPALLFFFLFAPASTLTAEHIDPGRGTVDADGETVWYDCRLLAVEGKGWETVGSFWDRLPSKAEGAVTSSVWNLSRHSAGMCVRFTTDAPSVQVRWTVLKSDLAMPHMPATGVSGVDLYVRDANGTWRFAGNGRPREVTNTAPFTLSPGAECLLYLPLYNGVKSVEIGVPAEKTLSTPEDSPRGRAKPVVFYGTSITQGGCASRPGMAATAIVGRKLDVPVINLGFSGSGKMEPAMADLLAELDPSVYVLDCLPNMTPEMVGERLEPFVWKLRGARPDTPILFAEDPSVKNVTPTEKGRVARAVYEKLKKEGMKNLFFLPNKGMLGTDFEGTVDGVHPNDLGMMRQADAFVRALAPIVKRAK